MYVLRFCGLGELEWVGDSDGIGSGGGGIVSGCVSSNEVVVEEEV